MPWKRPAEVPVGRVWSRFKGKERDGKPAQMYQIRDMGEYKKECLDLMREIFLRDEPLCSILGIPTDPVSISTIQANWEGFVAQDVSLACFTEVDGQPDRLVGCNIVMVKSVDDEEEEDIDQVQGESWKKLLATLTAAESLVDVFKHYRVDKYITSSGLTVLPAHRGMNIGARLFEARKPLAKALGIPATATVFTATTSQALAAKCGYEVLAELHYSEMKQRGVDLTGCPVLTAKVMGTKFQFD